ncbi:GNAT family N-acetyltransferase [Liquorilactobacillus vini]|uniref:GNAT family N-acetyltransferase n=1 Tax=Liquorilactobacillus vini TaxID=238015 RepID=UPI00030324B5
MQKIEIHSVKMVDLAAIMKIENSGFSAAEAASTQAMAERIKIIPETFLGAYSGEKLLGYLVGPAIQQRYLSDKLYERVTVNLPAAQAPYQAILSLAVAPAFQNRGIGSLLLRTLAQQAKVQRRRGLTLTCLTKLVSFYQKNDLLMKVDRVQNMLVNNGITCF